MNAAPVSHSEFEDEPSSYGLASVALTFCTAVVLLALAAMVVSRSFRHGEPRPPRLVLQLEGLAAGRVTPRHDHTVIYLVSSPDQGEALNDALTEWRAEVEALGTAAEQPKRVVVVQTREEILRQRVIDFAILAAQAPGLDLEVIDLRD